MAASPAVQAPSRPPSLPSLAATFGPFPSPSHLVHQHHAQYATVPTSASSATSTIESSAPLTPTDYLPPMPSPPPSTTRPSTRNTPPKLKRADFAVAPIPPFRGSGEAGGARRHSTASGPPSTFAPITPSSAVPPSHTKNDRRVSYPSVFSLPAPGPVIFSLPAQGSANRQPVANGITTGLGIEGVGVGAAGSKEALVIERLGEVPSGGTGGRRGSLKRVLVSDDEDQLAPVVQATSSGMNGRDPSFALPLQHPPAPPRHKSAPSLDRRRADSSSPKHPLGQAGERDGAAVGGGSPTLPNKRPRTRLSPLDSLADTATSLLSASAPASSQHNPHNQHSTTTGSASAGLPISSLLSGSSSSALEASKAIKEQQQREIDRRREAAGLATGPAPGSVQAALGKLRAQQQQQQGSASAAPASTSTTTTSGGGGLAKRRGHRPPAVATGSSAAAPASHRRNASTSHTAPAHDFALHHAPLRSAPAVEIPSVLVGSPLEATFAARAAAAREAAPPMRPSASSSGVLASSGTSSGKKDARRQSGSAQNHQPQPPLVSSSSYYIRPNQLLGPGVAFPPAPAPSTSPRTSTAGRRDDPKHVGPRLPPISRVTSGSGVSQQQQQQQQQPAPPPGLSHRSQSALAHLPAFYPPPPNQLPPYQPHSPLISAPLGPAPSTPLYPPHPSSAPAPASASKQAFLGLFSTFYDSLSDSRVLTHSLDYQVQRASAVLSTLQQAEGQLEALVDARVGEVRREWDERWRGVEERLGRLERAAGFDARDAPARFEERLARLERLGNAGGAAQQDGQVGQAASRRTSASTDSGVEGGTEGSVASAPAGRGAAADHEDEEMRQA